MDSEAYVTLAIQVQAQLVEIAAIYAYSTAIDERRLPIVIEDAQGAQPLLWHEVEKFLSALKRADG